MDFDYLVLVWVACGALFGWVLSAQWSVPWKRAALYRSLKHRDYEVAGVRQGGGQIKWSVVSRAQLPMIKASNNMTFIPNNSISNWIGSVRVHLFNDDDVNELNLSRDKVEELVRSPKHIDAFFMMAKAFYESLGARNQKILLWVCIGACLVGAASAYMSYTNSQALSALQAQQSALINLLNRTVASGELQNLVR